MAARVLLLFAHPALHLSRVHARWLEIARKTSHVTVHDLYANYPDDFIHVEREQALLMEHEIVLMQFPFYWFSTPSILKHWQDVVLEYNFAYGENAHALRGKYFGVITSTGGRDYSFRRGQGYRYAVRDYLLPLEMTFKLCGMNYLPPFVVHNGHLIEEEQFDVHTRNYRFYLDSLQSVQSYYEKWQDAVNINSVLF